jgi:tungstate transport system ATP-binding protein
VSGQEPVLRVADLRVERGGAEVLAIPEFSLAAGEFVSLIGPNGCGKSTLLLAILGLLPRASGRIVYRGRAVESEAEFLAYRRRIAMVLQEPLLFDTTVYGNVASGLKLRGLPRREVKAKAQAALERFGLAELGQRHARKLSGGEARRVSLARAFAVEPDLVFFDEPFANLDPPTRQALILDLERIVRETGIAAVLVSHDPSEALRLSDRIVVMHDGRIVQAGPPAEVVNHPANRFVARFVGMETLLDGVVTGRTGREIAVAVAGRTIRACGDPAEGTEVCCGIRPENVAIAPAAPAGDASADNVFAATVRDIASLGPFFRLSLDGGFPLVAYVTREACAALALEPGKEVLASFGAGAVHLIPAHPKA